MLKIYSKIKKSNYILKIFGFKYFFLDVLRRKVFSSTSKFGKKINKEFNKVLLNRLSKDFQNIIRKYKDDKNHLESTIQDDAPIWVFWWQGESNMPDITKMTLNSIKINSGNHSVIFLSKENVNNYCKIPNYIYDKLKSGTISLTNFSDILRFNLLSEYGGIWIDVTVLVTEKLSFLDNKFSLYTIHHQQFAETHICQGKWSTFFLGVSSDNSFAHYMNEMLLEYCSKYDYFVTYLLIDYFIAIAYEQIPQFHNIINKVPINNTGVFLMEEKLNSVENPEKQIASINKENTLFKLTYKKQFFEKINGKKTIYGILTDKYKLK